MFNAVLQLQSLLFLSRQSLAPHVAPAFLALVFMLSLFGTAPAISQDAVPIDVFVTFRGPDGRQIPGPGLVALRWYDYSNQVEPMCYPGSSLHLRLWPGAYWIYAHLNESLSVREIVETDENRSSFFGTMSSDSPTGGVILNISVNAPTKYLEFRMEPGSANRADVEQYCNPAATSSLDIHVDDADTGLALHDVPVVIKRIQDGSIVVQGITGRDGRTGPLAVPLQGAGELGEYRIEAGFANAERAQPQGYFAYEPRWSDVPPELLTAGVIRDYSVSLRRDGPAPEEVIVVTPREEGLCPAALSPEEWYLQVDDNIGLPGPHRILHDQYYLDEGVTIHPGQRITTPADLAGSALLALRPAALVSLEGGTVFSVPCSLAPGEENNIGMSVGGAYFEVQQIQGTEVEVYTRTAVTGTRGTKFRVGASETATEVAVFEGAVEVTPTNRSLGSLFVQTGQSVTVLSGSVGPLGSAGPAPASLLPQTNTVGPAAPVSQLPPTNPAGSAALVSQQRPPNTSGPVVPSIDVTVCGYRLSGAMHARWTHLNGEALLGCPTMSEVPALGSPQGSLGTWANFEHGLMTVMSAGPRPGSSYEVHGEIKNLYLQMQGSGSFLGFPLTDEYEVTEGRRSDFEGGYILWTRADNTARAHRLAE